MAFSLLEKAAFIELIEKQNLHIHFQKSWNNFSGNIELPDVLVLDIEDIHSLQAVLRYLYQLNHTKSTTDRILIRVAAGGRKPEHYSQSFTLTEQIPADIIIRLIGKDFLMIEATDQNNVIRLGASVQIHEAEEKLSQQFNLSLPTSSLIQWVTVSGLSANAGHGTGKDQPSFAGLITAMRLCLPNGNIVRIKDKSQNKLETIEDIELDPSIFEIIRGANFGLFGIILSVELVCRETKKLACYMRARTLPEFLDMVKQGEFLKAEYTSAMYVPTYWDDELTNTSIKNVIIYTWEPVDENNVNINCHPKLSHFIQELEVRLEDKLHITDLLAAEPSLIPYYMRYFVTRMTVGTDDKIALGPWANIMHNQTAFPTGIEDIDALMTLPSTSNGEEIAKIITQFVSLLKVSGLKGQYPIDYATYIRLFTGTNGGLSTSPYQEGEHTVGFDMVTSTGLPGYEKFRDEIVYTLVATFDAKLHWGKYVPTTLDYEKMYGKNFHAFKICLDEWYKRHDLILAESPFLNQFFCDILKLPAYQPTVSCQPTALKKSTQSAASLARHLLDHIKDDDIYAYQLKKRLQSIASNYQLSNISSFKQNTTSESNETNQSHYQCTIQ